MSENKNFFPFTSLLFTVKSVNVVQGKMKTMIPVGVHSRSVRVDVFKYFAL